MSAGCAGHPVSPPPLVLLKFKHILNRKFCAANGAPVTTRRGGYLTRDYSDYCLLCDAYAFTGLMMIIVLNISHFTTPYIIFARTIVWAGQTQPKLQSSFFQHISSPSTGYCQIHLCYPPITSPSVLSTLSRSYLNI